MNLRSAFYLLCLLCIVPSKLFTYDSEMSVYDVKTHKYLGIYQRIGTIHGYESGIIKMQNQTSLNVIEKPEQSTQGVIGYIKYKTSIRESRNSSKRSYLYQAEQAENSVEIECLKKKHNHLMA